MILGLLPILTFENSTQMTPPKLKVFVLVTCFAHVLSIVLFMCGFFPTKPVHVYSGRDQASNRSEAGLKMVGRTVLIVIDALRSDFITDHADQMPYVKRLIENGTAKRFVAKVHPPTVTMPRIKALTSGTIPGYVDLVLNLGSLEYAEDNLLIQATTNGLRIAFYGDDTWIRLFPRHFVRSEGTNSFYVKDFYQVDLNVTRHLDDELKHRHDWNLLVLHYLGLDHIGHTLGPRNHLIGLKLREMDDVVRFVHETLQMRAMGKEEDPPLIVISGDHGMSDYGGHGGASRQETTVPLIFVSSVFEGIVVDESEVEVLQIDVAVTVSLLLGLPIPKNSLGRLLLPLFSKLDWKSRLSLARSNAIQLHSVATEYSDDFTESCFRVFRTAEKQHSNWLANGAWDPENILRNYRQAAVEFSDLVSPRLTRFDGYTMIVAIFLQNMSLTFVLWVVGFSMNDGSAQFSFKTFVLLFAALVSLHTLACCTQLCSSSFLCNWSFSSIVIVFITAIVLATFLSVVLTTPFVTMFEKILQCILRLDFSAQFLLLGCLVHSCSFSATSFIEEEHQTWYFLCTTFLLIRTYTCVVNTNNQHENEDRPYFRILRLVLILVIFRIVRSWNSTGDKWAHLEDTGDWLNRTENECWLSFAMACSLLLLVYLRSRYHRWPVTAFFGLTCLSTYLYHYASGAVLVPFLEKSTHNLSTSVMFAKINYGLIFLLAIFSIVASRRVGERFEAVVTVWLALSVLLVRPHNVLLVTFWSLMKELYCFKRMISRSNPEWIAAIPFVWMAQASFFQQGYSNSLGKIEVATGFVGLEAYNPFLVGGLLLCSVYSGPVFWILSFVSIVQQINVKRIHLNIFYCLLFFILSRILPWSLYSILVYVQRYHLFVWTVFAPKIIFEATHSVVFGFIISITSLTVS